MFTRLNRTVAATVLTVGITVGMSSASMAMQGISKSDTPYVPGELLIKYKDGADSASATAAIKALGVKDVRGFRRPRQLASAKADSLRHLRLNDGVNMGKVMDLISRNPDVEWVEPNYIVTAQAVPNDPSFWELWGMNNYGQTGGTANADIDAPEAWDLQTGDGSIIVAVVDTGIDYNHPDLAANVWTNPGEIAGNGIDDDANGYVDDIHGYDFVNNDGDPFDDNEHGTHVSGTIGAVGNNGIGVAGVNWNVQIMAAKFLDRNGSGTIADAVDAVLYAVDNGARVQNHSWGGGTSNALSAAIADGAAAGVLIAIAAGNGDFRGNPVDCDTGSFWCQPATDPGPNVVAVAATDHNDDIASFSNFGLTTVDLGAPGVSVLSTTPGNTYSSFNGTSMATPHVAGAAAILFADDPTRTYVEVKDLLLNNVDPIPALAGKTVTGGRLNLYSALTDTGGGPGDNIPPVADAGPDQTVAPGDVVILDGTGSSDADGTIVSYNWTPIRPAQLRIRDADTAIAMFRVPPRINRAVDIIIDLTVTDDQGATSTDTVIVSVQPVL